MNVNRSIQTTTNISVELTTEDIQEFIRNKFNLSTHTPITVDYSNTINGRIKIHWIEHSTSN